MVLTKMGGRTRRFDWEAMRSVRGWWGSALVLCVLGCEPEPIAPIEGEYFPLVSGARWVYGDGGSEFRTSVVERAELDGELVFMRTDSSTGSENSKETLFLVEDTRAVRRWRRSYQESSLDSLVEYAPGFVGFDRQWLEMREGESVRIEFQRRKTRPLGKGGRWTVREHEYTIESRSERVRTPAGTFSNCLRVRRETREDDSLRSTKVLFFAPSVGIVRHWNRTSGELHQLVDFEIPE